MTKAHPQVEPELIRLGSMEIRYLQAAGNGCEMGVFEVRVPPACQVPPPHSHLANEELLYVLEGTLRYTVGGETRDLRPGDFMLNICDEVDGAAQTEGTVDRTGWV